MPEAVSLARSAEQTVFSIRIDGLKPDQLALILICNVLGRHLSSGEHHTYRGVLGFMGSDMLQLWTKAIATLRERGYYTDEQANDDMSWIKEQIKNVG